MRKELLAGSALLLLMVLPYLCYANVEQGDQQTDIGDFFVGFGTTLVLELASAWIFLVAIKINEKNVWKVLAAVAAVNVASVPIVWVLSPFLAPIVLAVFIMELVVIVLEAVALYYLNKWAISLKHALALSAIMNAVSFFIGGALFVIFSKFV